MSEAIELIAPKPGTLRLRNRRPTMGIRVRVQSSAKVVAVHAEAYKDTPPKSPKHPLHSPSKSKVFEGEVPGLPGQFWVRARAEFEDAPPAESSFGPYELLWATSNSVDVKNPPGQLSVGPNNEVTVKAQVEAIAFVSSVVAHCIKSPEGGDIGPDEPLMEEDPIEHPGLYTGQVTARKPGSFRIKATATFDDGMGTFSTKDDVDGDYHG